jgi:hypothetical protein
MARKFIDLYEVYGDVEIKSKTYTIAPEEWKEGNTYGNQKADELFIPHTEIGKKYMTMKQNEDGLYMMSDHPTERLTNQMFIDVAKGDVIIFGLGIGMIIVPLLESDEIKSILIVEKDAELIKDILPIIKKRDARGILKVVEGDAFNYHETLKEEKFDTIYFDIWQNVDNTAYNEMMFLHKSYHRFLKSDSSFIDSWLFYQRLKMSIVIK